MVLYKWAALSFSLYLTNLSVSFEFMVFSVVGAFLNFLNLLPVIYYSTSLICSKFKFPDSSVFLFVIFWNLGIRISHNLYFSSFID